ncbi:MAG: hypothetical protein WCV50_06295 [Patescibacteria group bacterium]|jgi:hypothetical protein
MKKIIAGILSLAGCAAYAFIPIKAVLPSFVVHTAEQQQSVQTQKYPNTPFKDFGSDAPWVHRAGLAADIPVITFIKDADQDSVLLDYVRFIRQDTGQSVGVYNPVPDITLDQPYWWLRLNGLTPNSLGLAYGDTLKLRVEIHFRDQLIWHNYTQNLQIKIAQPWPELSGWYRGDTHHHSWYTQDTFDFGSELGFDADAAKDIGLSWVALTEHSYDVTQSEWQDMKTRTASLSSPQFQLLPGLEFSADSNNVNDPLDDRIHIVGLGLQNWIAGPDIVPTFDVNATQPKTLSAVLSDIEAQNGIAYTAHPETNSIPIDIYGFLAKWTDQNYSEAQQSKAFMGLQIFNERPTSENNTSITTDNINPFPWIPNPNWDTEWLRGIAKYNSLVKANLTRKLFMLGGADAHGDANYKTFNAQGAFNFAANETAYGRIHTALYLPNGLTNESIIDALRNGQAISTDGPLGAFDIRNNQDEVVASIGDTLPYTDGLTLHINAASSAEFGNFDKAVIHVLAKNDERHIDIPLSGLQAIASKELSTFGITAPFAVWVETRTQSGYRSFANPIWIYPAQVCGDADGDGSVNIADAVYTVNYIFNHGPQPYYGDNNNDGMIDISDVVYLVSYIFSHGPAPLCGPLKN